MKAFSQLIVASALVGLSNASVHRQQQQQQHQLRRLADDGLTEEVIVAAVDDEEDRLRQLENVYDQAVDGDDEYDYFDEYDFDQLYTNETATVKFPSFHLKYSGQCTRVRDGTNQHYKTSSHSYRSNYKQVLTFRTCKGKSHFWDLSFCNRTVQHVVEMEDYFKGTRNCMQDYCNECYSSCTNATTCHSSCATKCSKYYAMSENGCSQVYARNGNTYYYGPQCNDKGGMKMGYFYDNECQLRVEGTHVWAASGVSFLNFDVFKFVNDICTKDCTANGNCEDFYDTSSHCLRNLTAVAYTSPMRSSFVDEENEHGDEHRNEVHGEGCEILYKAKQNSAKDASKSSSSSSSSSSSNNRSSSRNSRNQLTAGKFVSSLFTTLVIVSAASLAAFLAVSYTYYARHRLSWGVSSLATDGDETLGTYA